MSFSTIDSDDITELDDADDLEQDRNPSITVLSWLYHGLSITGNSGNEGHWFRLLRLEPGASDQYPIYANLIRRPIYDDVIPYKALSYSRGDGPLCERIMIGGLQEREPFAVTLHLWQAIRRLRHKSRPVFVWIDAICIHQADLDECAAQVPIMAEIYGNAAEVVIWLGEDVSWPSGTDAPLTNQAIRMFAAQQCPWWTRMWVLQECTYATKCPSVWLADAVISLEEFAERWRSAAMHSLDTAVQDGCRLAQTLVDAWRAQAHHGIARRPLCQRIQEARNRQCTKPHDKLYALINLIPEAEAALLPPDYRIPMSELMADVVLIMLKTPNWKLNHFRGLLDTFPRDGTRAYNKLPGTADDALPSASHWSPIAESILGNIPEKLYSQIRRELGLCNVDYILIDEIDWVSHSSSLRLEFLASLQWSSALEQRKQKYHSLAPELYDDAAMFSRRKSVSRILRTSNGIFGVFTTCTSVDDVSLSWADALIFSPHLALGWIVRGNHVIRSCYVNSFSLIEARCQRVKLTAKRPDVIYCDRGSITLDAVDWKHWALSAKAEVIPSKQKFVTPLNTAHSTSTLRQPDPPSTDTQQDAWIELQATNHNSIISISDHSSSVSSSINSESHAFLCPPVTNRITQSPLFKKRGRSLLSEMLAREHRKIEAIMLSDAAVVSPQMSFVHALRGTGRRVKTGSAARHLRSSQYTTEID